MPPDDGKTPPPLAPCSTKSEPQPKSFWLVLIKDAADVAPKCIRCENAESLSRALSEHVLSSAEPLHAFAFEGQRIAISSPRPICSFSLDGKNIDVGRDSAEFDEGGRVVPLTKPGTAG